MDEQGRSGHDVPADGDSAARARRAASSKRRTTLPCCTRTSDDGGGNREFRVIPTDGRKHDPQKAIEATYMGYTVGHWEGDTLVLDSISFVDTTWLGRGGLFHSANMHIVEKFTRKGDEILYEITIEDPDVLVEPWVMPPRTLRLNRVATPDSCRSEPIARSTSRATSPPRFGTSKLSRRFC